jgi:hypothetical protein
MRSKYTQAYYHKPQIVSIERPTYRSILYSEVWLRPLFRFRSSRLLVLFPLIPLNYRVRSRTAHNALY